MKLANLALALSFAALLLGGAGCSDQDNAPGATATVTPAETRAPAGQAGLDVLRQLAGNFGKTTYRLVYQVTGTDASGGRVDATLSMAADPPRQLVGIAGDVGGKVGQFLLIDDGQASFVCVDSNGSQGCLKGKSSGRPTVPLPSFLNVESLMRGIADQPGAGVDDAPDQQIAGRQAKCWDVKGQQGNGRFCVDARDQGTLLLLEGDFGTGKFSMKAKEVGKPSSKDFEPPFKVTDAP